VEWAADALAHHDTAASALGRHLGMVLGVHPQRVAVLVFADASIAKQTRSMRAPSRFGAPKSGRNARLSHI